MWRYKVVELDRTDATKRDELLWEIGHSGWELVQVHAGSFADPADAKRICLWFKREAATDIGG